MADDRTYSSLQSRKELLLAQLQLLPQNEPRPLWEIVRAAGFELRKNDDPSKPASESALSERQVKYAIQEVESRLRPLEVFYESGNVVLRIGTGTAFNRRKQRAAATKRALGTAIWHYLLGPNWRGLQKDLEFPEIKYTIEGCQERIEDKRLTFRRRNQLYFSCDAGTTTLAIIQELLTTHRIPIEVHITPEDEGKGNASFSSLRLVEPVILTNSIPIISEIINHEKHCHTFLVECIGGQARPNRKCLTGSKASLWLKACCGLGLIGTLDLAIVGASGAYIGSDCAYAACDDPEEAALKMSLLELAQGSENHSHMGGLRIIVFHSAKLLYPESRCRFASLNRSMVDLVVTDSGENPSECKRIDEMIVQLKQFGVAVLKVDLESVNEL